MGALSISTLTISPAAVSANTTAEQTFALSGVVAADSMVLAVSKPTAQAGLGIVGWRVSSDGNIGITFSNNTAGSITPTASEAYKVAWVRSTAALPKTYQLALAT
mgnify:CR=1 FL=1